MEGSPFTSFHQGEVFSPFNASPFATTCASPFNSFPSSFSSPFASPLSVNCVAVGRVRNRDCFEAQQQEPSKQFNPFQHQQQQQPMEDSMMCFSSPAKKMKQSMEVEKNEYGFGEPNTSTRDKRKRGGPEEMCADKPPKIDRTTKQRKMIHKKPDAKDIPKARMVHVRFGPDLTQTVEAKILYKEPWGVMVQLLETREELGAEKGRRYWTKFSGNVCPISNIPILDAVHPC